ncbi:Polyubiquitin-like protein [Drosera capensis]
MYAPPAAFLPRCRSTSKTQRRAPNVGRLPHGHHHRDQVSVGAPRISPSTQATFDLHRRQLENDRTLADYNITNESTLHLGGETYFVKKLDGKTLTLEVSPMDTVLALKAQIEFLDSVPGCKQCLIFTGEQLEDENTLGHYPITKHSTIHLVLRLMGEAKKKKKKMYSMPKKVKEKEDGVGCGRVVWGGRGWERGEVEEGVPESRVWRGVFMAEHFDRVCCGKCGLAYMFQDAANGDGEVLSEA